MTITEKRIYILVLSVLVILAATMVGLYYHRVNQIAKASSGEESPIGSGYRCTTTESQLTETQNGSKTSLSKTFTHKIYDPSGEQIAELETTFVGNIDTDSASATSVNATFTKEYRSGLTLSQHCSNDTGTVIVYLNQSGFYYFQYRISTNGTIELL